MKHVMTVVMVTGLIGLFMLISEGNLSVKLTGLALFLAGSLNGVGSILLQELTKIRELLEAQQERAEKAMRKAA